MDHTVTRFPNGLGTVGDQSMFADLKVPLPLAYHVFFDDFDRYAAADWTVTETSGSATQGIVDGDGGLLRLTNVTGDNGIVQLQSKEGFKFVAGKKVFYEVSFESVEATQVDLFAGLMITGTDPVAGVTDGVFFRKDDGDTNIDVVVTKDSAVTTAVAATLAANTRVKLGFYYNGVDSIQYAVDGVVKGSLAVTNLPDDEELAVTLTTQNGQTTSSNMTIDYVFVAKER